MKQTLFNGHSNNQRLLASTDCPSPGLRRAPCEGGCSQQRDQQYSLNASPANANCIALSRLHILLVLVALALTSDSQVFLEFLHGAIDISATPVEGGSCMHACLHKLGAVALGLGLPGLIFKSAFIASLQAERDAALKAVVERRGCRLLPPGRSAGQLALLYWGSTALLRSLEGLAPTTLTGRVRP